jgi:CheY-like chemotaxis protein
MPAKLILVVEDEAVQLAMVTKFLKGAGYGVIEARDGMAAISIARKEHPDLVLLDLGLPQGDGFAVMQRLQLLPSTAKIPVVVLSSRDAANTEDAAKQAGARAYLQKPVDKEKLLKAIGETIENPR